MLTSGERLEVFRLCMSCHSSPGVSRRSVLDGVIRATTCSERSTSERASALSVPPARSRRVSDHSGAFAHPPAALGSLYGIRGWGPKTERESCSGMRMFTQTRTSMSAAAHRVPCVQVCHLKSDPVCMGWSPKEPVQLTNCRPFGAKSASVRTRAGLARPLLLPNR